MAVLLVLSLAVAAQAQDRSPLTPTAVSPTARAILERVTPAMIQIKSFFGANTAEASHGSGFAVAPGLFLTNWHVISDAVLYPEKYRLEYRTPSGATGRVSVRAIDVRHDLAVVEAPGLSPLPLPLRSDVAIKGERAFSVGFPLDVGLTITEGVSNGRVEDSFEARVHYSGALNAGMSGGPGLDAVGNVIGVNVAGYRGSQLVAFFVPGEHAVTLLGRAQKSPLDPTQARQEIASQIRAHSEALLAAFGSTLATHTHGGYALPAKLASFVECRAAGDPAPDRPVHVERITCDAKSSLYLTRNTPTGGLAFQHQVLRADTLDAWRFAYRMQETKAPYAAFGSPRQLAPFACRQQNVELKGFTANATVCLRAYRRLDGVYDLNVRVVSKNEPRRGFVSSLSVTGVAADRALAFVRTYLEAMRWKP